MKIRVSKLMLITGLLRVRTTTNSSDSWDIFVYDLPSCPKTHDHILKSFPFYNLIV